MEHYLMRARKLAALAAGVTLLGGIALAGSGAASAASLPSCANGYHCTSNPAGEGGYYGADDNHTHYRFAETEVTANGHLVNLNGTSTPGAVGVELCDPNTGDAEQVGLWWDAANGPSGGFDVSYGNGRITGAAHDPCIQDGLIAPLGDSKGDAAELVGPAAPTTVRIALDDVIYLGEYYDPAGRFYHQLSYGMCDITAGWCRQAWSTFTTQQAYFEFGIGALSAVPALTGGAVNPVDTFAVNRVTCYSCAASVPVSSVRGFYGPGGLYEAQWVNSSDQVEMGPLDSLAADGNFSLFEGSTSP